jgi:hypothetical protein
MRFSIVRLFGRLRDWLNEPVADSFGVAEAAGLLF